MREITECGKNNAWGVECINMESKVYGHISIRS